MFDFDNIKKFFKYDWHNMIDTTVPKGNKTKISEESYKDIQNGAIVKIIAACVSLAATVGISMSIASLASSWLGINLFGINADVDISFSIFSFATLPIAILLYNVLMREKEQNSYPHFVVGIVLLIQSLYTLFSFITWIASFFISPLFGFLGILGLIIDLFGNIHVIVGCVDFCQANRSAYEAANNPVKEEEPAISTKPIKTDEVSLHTDSEPKKRGRKKSVKFCTHCGMQLPENAQFCGNCGTKIK